MKKRFMNHLGDALLIAGVIMCVEDLHQHNFILAFQSVGVVLGAAWR